MTNFPILVLSDRVREAVHPLCFIYIQRMRMPCSIAPLRPEQKSPCRSWTSSGATDMDNSRIPSDINGPLQPTKKISLGKRWKNVGSKQWPKWQRCKKSNFDQG